MNSRIQTRERDFHDAWAGSIDPATVMVLQTFEACTSPEPRWLANQLGDLKGKTLLDLGTGAGESAVYFALQGAKVTATDLSPGMLDVAARVAQYHGVALDCRLVSAEDLRDFGDASFDFVFGANVLHHVDIGQCLDEVKRVLKPTGIGAFWDPVAYNPVINIYRRMAMPVRTEDEHPLRRPDLQHFRSRFRSVRTRFFWLTSLVVFLKFYLLDRVHPSQDRYWKRVVAREEELVRIYRPLEKLDRGLLRLFPFLGWLGWTIAVVVRK